MSNIVAFDGEKPDESFKSKERLTHTDAFLSVPGAEVVLRTQDGHPMELERLIQILGRAAATDPGRKVDAWIKFLP